MEKRKNKPGAGRPKVENLRTMRGLKFSDEEWGIIKEMAAEKGMSPRAFLSSLVGTDNPYMGETENAGGQKEGKMENRFLKIEDWMEVSEMGYWLVDEIIYDPHFIHSGCMVKDRGKYYFMKYCGFNLSTVTPRPHFNDSPVYDREEYNHGFFTRGCEPRTGFKRKELMRAITDDEFNELKNRFSLTEDDISEEFEETNNSMLGPKYEVKFTVKQIRVPAQAAISLEGELGNKGIEAFSANAGRLNIRVR